MKFEFAVVNPTGSCILYRETSGSLDMRNSGGVFDVPIGPGTKNYPADPGFKLLDSFANSTTFNCEGGGTYTPLTDDKRLLRVQFYDGTGWKLISPDSEIRSVPFAGHAKIAQTANSLGSNVVSDFVLKSSVPLCAAGQYLRHIAPLGTFECAAPSVAGGNVTGNIAGSSAGFTGNLSGDVSGTQAATSVDKIKGVALDMTGIASGKVLKYNGTSWIPSDDSGTVGGITTLNGDVSSTGNPTATVTLNDSTVTSAKIVDGTIVDADISSSAGIADSKLATISSAGKVSGNAITSGTIGGSTTVNTSGSVTANSMSTGTLGVNNLQVYKTGNGNKVTITVPAGLSSDYSLQLPSSAGTSGQVLSTDGSGILSWINPATGSVTSVTATAPLASSGGATPVISLNTSGVQTGQTLLYNGTQWNVQYFGMGQLRSTVTGTSQIPASCSTADKTLTWSAITDSFSCTTIAIANTQVTGLGTASTKNFGTSAGNLVELDGSAKIPVSLLPQGAGGTLVDGGNATGAAISVGTNDANALSLETNNAVRMTITSAGNIGVGTEAPQHFMHLSKDGDLSTILDSYGGSAGLVMRKTSGTKAAPTATLSGADLGVLVFGGYGASSFHSYSAAKVSAIANENFTDATGAASLVFSTRGPNDLSASDERMRITPTGDVGIGTSIPGAKLEVQTGNIRSSRSAGVSNQYAEIQGGDPGGIYFVGHTDESNKKLLRFRSLHNSGGTPSGALGFLFELGPTSAPIEVMRITEEGHVGIGTAAPTAPLNVVESTDITSAVDGGAILIHTGATHQMRIDSNEIQTSLSGAASSLAINPFGGVVQVGAVFQPLTDNSFTLGSAARRWSAVYATNGTIQTSDRRLKKDIQDLNVGLRFINSLRPVSFKWRSDEPSSAPTHWGLIAQELHDQVNREGTDNVGVVSKKDDYYGVNYSELVGPLINAVKELDVACKMSEQQNKSLSARLASQDRRLASVEEDVLSLKKENAELKARLQRLERVLAKQSRSK
ncbi:tail fiber domain-containing protein [Bdellovibrio sp. 22V]|uniref:tail fiber domain-containing protein n=1 Tax=Bdellovibrio sp. 22V TaxID=3044166 RepID=UPI0025439488|nr:tail fiber domain-containing protein [Bdellovibrio sp. 22V]WII70684.1 tail fiber domain-containing protein [Bdellovibrio sp. 22V]